MTLASKLVKVLFVTAGLALGVTGCGEEKEAAATPTAQPAEVADAVEVQTDFADRPGFHVGVLMPASSVELAPTYDGTIRSIHVKVGDHIEKGTAVATFDEKEAREALRMAEADLRGAKGAAASAWAVARNARRRLETEKKLFQQGITASNAVDDARAQTEQAGAAGSGAAGGVAAAKVKVEQLQRQLQEMDLAAPFSGKVAMVYRKKGAQAGPNRPVLKLIGTERTLVRFAVPPEQAETFAIGQSVEVHVDWLEAPLAAVIHEVAPEVDAPTGLVFLEAELTSEPGELRPHSPAWVSRRT